MAGLLHISQISYDRVDNLETLFTIGQKCKVMILDHDKANGRVALSTKTLEPAPGDMLKNMENVFSQAEATAARYHERIGKNSNISHDIFKSPNYLFSSLFSELCIEFISMLSLRLSYRDCHSFF
jgi:predicted RNA-binding protein with RPS1 domain